MPLALPAAVESAIRDAQAMVRVGYPWWLRPFLASDVIAITLGRTIYLSGKATARSSDYLSRLVRHELAHVQQVNRHGLIPFLVRYVAEFLRLLARERSVNTAYRNISFEVEARAAEESL
jgi:hypothetical protein